MGGTIQGLRNDIDILTRERDDLAGKLERLTRTHERQGEQLDETRKAKADMVRQLLADGKQIAEAVTILDHVQRGDKDSASIREFVDRHRMGAKT